MTDIKAGRRAGSEDDLRPSPAVLIGGAAAIGLISALPLPCPAASEFMALLGIFLRIRFAWRASPSSRIGAAVSLVA
jgi:hypothetical protein